MRSHEAGALHAEGYGGPPLYLPFPDDVMALLPQLWPETVGRDAQGRLTVAGPSSPAWPVRRPAHRAATGSAEDGTSRKRRSMAACSSTGSSSDPVATYTPASTPPSTPVVRVPGRPW